MHPDVFASETINQKGLVIRICVVVRPLYGFSLIQHLNNNFGICKDLRMAAVDCRYSREINDSNHRQNVTQAMFWRKKKQTYYCDNL